jgi:SAM-dependent methyltransferase
VKNKWRMYGDLAWTELIGFSPEDGVKETELYSKAIKKNSKIETKTLLHLACGAGLNDYTFKKHFKVTGVDISKNMLALAKELNPEVIYHHGDMRTIELGEKFDAVAIPDSIGYMTTTKDIRKTLLTASKHLKAGGVLLIVANLKEQFKENNFVYTGSRGDIDITIFENNHILKPDGSTYEGTMIFLIRRKGKPEIHTDRHILGLFDSKTWASLLKEEGFEIRETKTEHFYDRYLLEEGEYPLQILVCIKS